MFLTTWWTWYCAHPLYMNCSHLYIQCIVHWLYVGYLGNMWLNESHYGFHRDPNSNRCSLLSLLKWLFRGPLVCSDTPIRLKESTWWTSNPCIKTPFQRIHLVQRPFIWLQPMDKKQWSRWGRRNYRGGHWGSNHAKSASVYLFTSSDVFCG
jgi:hypothetical protein